VPGSRPLCFLPPSLPPPGFLSFRLRARKAGTELPLFISHPLPSSLLFFLFSELKAKGSRKSADSRIHACTAFYSSAFLLFSVVFLKSRVHVHLFESITSFPGCLLSVSQRTSKAPAFPNDRITSYYYRPVEQNHVFRMITKGLPEYSATLMLDNLLARWSRMESDPDASSSCHHHQHHHHRAIHCYDVAACTHCCLIKFSHLSKVGQLRLFATTVHCRSSLPIRLLHIGLKLFRYSSRIILSM